MDTSTVLAPGTISFQERYRPGSVGGHLYDVAPEGEVRSIGVLQESLPPLFRRPQAEHPTPLRRGGLEPTR